MILAFHQPVQKLWVVGSHSKPRILIKVYQPWIQAISVAHWPYLSFSIAVSDLCHVPDNAQPHSMMSSFWHCIIISFFGNSRSWWGSQEMISVATSITYF
jgi:hypothetical protein